MNKSSSRPRSQGFSLVELMVGIVLGLLVVVAVGNIFLAGRKTMNATDALGRTQEATRVSFELLTRDIREAGGNPCSASVGIGNSLRARSSAWWAAWSKGLRGYTASQTTEGTATGTAVGTRVANTDALDVYSAFEADATVATNMTTGSSDVVVGAGSFVAGDLAMVCDTAAAFVFQISGVGGGGTQLQHSDATGTPGNCARVFSYNDPCNNSATGYLFKQDAIVSKVSSYRWYVGNNASGTRSLYRARLTNRTTGSAPTVIETVEVAPGVDSMGVMYLVRGGTTYVAASAVADWGQVQAVRIQLGLASRTSVATESGVGGDGRTMRRTMTQVVALRNR